MTIQEIYEKFATLKTSSDKLFFIDEFRFLTNNKVINFDLNFDSIEESVMNEAQMLTSFIILMITMLMFIFLIAKGL